MRSRGWPAVLIAALAIACEVPALVGTRELDAEPDSETGDETDEPPLLDLPFSDCEPPAPVSCDSSSEDPLQIVGLDCIDGIPAAGGFFGEAAAMASHDAETFGPLGPYAAREGSKFLILSTGVAAQLKWTHEQIAELGCSDPERCPSTDFGIGPAHQLPPPLTFDRVDEDRDCIDDPALVGQGDCSNSLFAECGGQCEVWDYAELRINLTVPERTHGLAFDFAFMSVEWPKFQNTDFNDMFVAWLESERWTGNVSFDELGQPITVNSGFTDYIGDELDGFAMEGHAGTRWLTTAFGLEPGESIQLVLAVLDLADGALDSVVLLDDFRWTCTETPPTTKPVP